MAPPSAGVNHGLRVPELVGPWFHFGICTTAALDVERHLYQICWTLRGGVKEDLPDAPWSCVGMPIDSNEWNPAGPPGQQRGWTPFPDPGLVSKFK